MAVFIAAFTVIGLFMVGLAVPLYRRRVKPNGLYGLRVAATFADEWVWYEANARSARDLLVVAAIQVAVALLLPLAPGMTLEIYILANSGVLLTGVLASAVIGWLRANRLLRTRRAVDASP